MLLLVGLGNPGPKYEKNRHNIGFMVIDALAQRWGGELNQKKFNGMCATVQFNHAPVVLLKPQTF
ncbi:MAG: aminoacyl-tRNA hydrolase, partial [Alphaproteobacteria bacterium]|nr:aminoacyl-tRNA hydrolase [Alphaproteobacteria bacterium]